MTRLLWLALAACSPEPPPELDLADMAQWVQDPGPDPLASHREADDPDCLPQGTIAEGLTLEVDTAACPYAFLTQPLAGSFDEGAPLEIVFWHADLAALEPSEGHIALFVEGRTLWERWIGIPGEPCAYTDVIEAPFAAESGMDLQLHLHNHGANTWNLRRVRRSTIDTPLQRSPGCEDEMD